ncbi:MAG: alpha/beta hydrolase fold domain-containing protein [Nocardioides sp.]|uniref:alpha/beta hydrolase fold domain-containing protein n=1 Tax=Nocardioides sp. TaxID=35761 RepID=UPI003F062077
MTDALEQEIPVETARPRPPAPTTISAEAQAFLTMLSAASPAREPWPAQGDLPAWEARIEVMDQLTDGFYGLSMPPEGSITRERQVIGGVPTWVLVPAGVEEPSSVVIDIHGGALMFGGGELAWKSAAAAAAGRASVTWSPDYRMPPAAPYPAGLDDCLALYREALDQFGADNVVVGGASAGGNLAAALLLRARDEGLPMPAGLALRTPELDLTEAGDTWRTNDGIDILSSVHEVSVLYADGHELDHPYLSPIYGDVSGFPRTFLQSGTRDVLLSETVRMHRALLRVGVPAELHVMEAMPHGRFSGATPEDRELLSELVRFERECLGLA